MKNFAAAGMMRTAAVTREHENCRSKMHRLMDEGKVRLGAPETPEGKPGTLGTEEIMAIVTADVLQEISFTLAMIADEHRAMREEIEEIKRAVKFGRC